MRYTVNPGWQATLQSRRGDTAKGEIDFPAHHPVQTLNSRSNTVRGCLASDRVDLTARATETMHQAAIQAARTPV
jgi:hypothetical protein